MSLRIHEIKNIIRENLATDEYCFERFISTLSDKYNTIVYLAIPCLVGYPDEFRFVYFPNVKKDTTLYIENDFDVEEKIRPSDFCLEINISTQFDIKKNPFILLDVSNNLSLEDRLDLTAAVHLFICNYIETKRRKIRRSIIKCKLIKKDLGSFLSKAQDIIIESLFKCEGLSFFVFSRATEELKLRSTTGLLNGRANLDNVFGLHASSYVVKSFARKEIIVEYNENSELHIGKTTEITAQPIKYRAYFPIQTLIKNSMTKKPRHERPACNGVIRLVNLTDNDNNIILMNTIEQSLFEFLCEVIYINIESFVDGEVAGFDKDLAFHAASSVADGVLKNIEMAQSLLFGGRDHSIYSDVKPQFNVLPIGQFSISELERCFNISHAFTLDMLSQIERSIIIQSQKRGEKPITLHLLADVIQKAVDIVPAMLTSHSVGVNQCNVSKIFDLTRPSPVYGKTGELINVFKNLFDNSVKYKNPDKKLQIDVSLIQDASFVIVEIRDNGIGVSEDDISRLFTVGFRSTNAREYRVRGSGLGLAYCRALIESTEGKIWAERRSPGLSVFVKLRRVPFPAR